MGMFLLAADVEIRLRKNFQFQNRGREIGEMRGEKLEGWDGVENGKKIVWENLAYLL